MKKTSWCAMTVLAVAVLVLSCLGCVDCTLREVGNTAINDPIDLKRGVLPLTILPTLFSVFAFARKNKLLNGIASGLLFLQAVAVTVADSLYEFVDKVTSSIVGRTEYVFALSAIGAAVSALCWLLFVLSIFSASLSFESALKEWPVLPKSLRSWMAVLLIVLGVTGFSVVEMYVEITKEISLFGVLFLAGTLWLLGFACAHSVKTVCLTKRTQNLWNIAVVILAFVVQIVFRDAIKDAWQDMFLTIGSGVLPDMN